MNYIRQLTGFFHRAAKDYQLNPTHVSLYIAIFQLWNLNRFKSPISVSRSELMTLSKVSSKTTYHKCMRELQQFGYIRYDPSYHPLRGSLVYLFDFDLKDEKNQSKICPGNGLVLNRQETSAGQAVYKSSSEMLTSKGFQRPLNMYKHIKHNKLSLRQPIETLEKMKRERYEIEKNNLFSVADDALPASQLTPGTSAKAETDECSRMPGPNLQQKVPESEAQVIRFFLDSGYEELQGIKFYQYYAALGWKVGGKAEIENWRAAAHGWILKSQNNGKNAKSIKPTISAGRLHASSDKNYSEPL
jgi:hypothetical protein